MHYRRERFMIPMIVVSTLLVVAIGLSIYGFMVDRPELLKKIDGEIESREKVEKNLNQLAKDNITLEDFIGLKGSKDAGISFKDEWFDDIDGKKKLSLERMREYFGKQDRNGIADSNNILEYVIALEDHYKAEISKLEIAKTGLDVQINDLKNEKATLDNQITRLTQTYEDVTIPKLKEDYERQLSDLEHDKKQAEDELKAKVKLWEKIEAEYDQLKLDKKALEEKVRELVAQNASLNKRIANLEIIVDELKRGKTKEYTRKVIGEIITVETGADGILGSIDLGAKDGLKKGIIFEVMHGDDIKGRIRIIQVNEETAIFQVIATTKESDPIIAGDKISSPLFTPGEKPEFVIIGRFKTRDFPHSREDIKYLIEEWGGKVADEITANTRYAIVGDGVLEDELRTIGAYGIERINKARLKDFLEAN